MSQLVQEYQAQSLKTLLSTAYGKCTKAIICENIFFVRRKLQSSVSESSKQEDFSHLASIKALVTDMEALKEHVRRSSHLLEVIIG